MRTHKHSVAPKQPLTPQRIFETALLVLDESGIEALSMRVLAKRLQVKAASLYNHVPSKSALLDGVQALVFSTVQVPLESLEWKQYLTKLAHAFRKTLRAHPHTALLFASRPALSPAALRAAERTVKRLNQSGFSVTNAMYLYQSLAVFVIGHALAELDPQGLEDPTKVQDPTLFRNFPTLASISLENAQDTESWFAFGIQLFLQGAEAVLLQTTQQISNNTFKEA